MADNAEDVKEMILDTNPILFAVTIIVSVLHSIFEMLAIKNGINYFNVLVEIFF